MTARAPSLALNVVWRPQAGPQADFVRCPLDDVCYGGARGGGKTDGSLGDFAIHAGRYGRGAKGIFLRRTLIALQPTIERAKVLYLPLGAKWQEAPKSRFVFPNGALLYFRYLEKDKDADGYQGHDYTRVYAEEITQFPSPKPLDKMKATLRSALGVPTGFRATCNPGGPGHTWVKQRYIDQGAYNVVREKHVNPFTGEVVVSSRVFIPAKLSDNPALLLNDPRYVANLYQAGSETLVKAWLDGDWNVVEGAFFDCWSTPKHVVEPFTLPAMWTRFRSFDWGSAHPFSVGWWSVVGDDYRTPGGIVMPRGALLRYREWYGAKGENVGLKLTTAEVAQGIRARDGGDHISYSVADPAIFAEDGGPSRAEAFGQSKVWFTRADNKRTSQNGAAGGWDEMRARMKGSDGVPMLYVFKTCKDFIRTVPVLPHDPVKPEDIDTDAEDHIADEARYACMSRPWIKKPKEREKKRDAYQEYSRSQDDGIATL